MLTPSLIIALSESDEELRADLIVELDRLRQTCDDALTKLWLSGPHDINSAYLDIHAGSGGTDACDWASMLVRMYTKWAYSRNYTVKLISETTGDVTGIKHATLLVQGSYAYGYAQYETGVHRLVRTSPFDAKGARHTSFASVRVTPYLESQDLQDRGIKLNEADLKVTTMRSQGPGGQHVNKTESAVRAEHIPTGITVTCQQERSQPMNRRLAIDLIKHKLYELKLRKRERSKADAHSQLPEISWGSQIRSYVLHPYRLVKDTRSGYEVCGNWQVDAVLDGEITE
ncbi:peptide chain release factor [Irpex rosettiformis]|uniref:Peptide chain release factor n=1 Tax=Irpex rosettiformis TaxID=378272 RepID=A0ACB8U524_9APHY|nr:peptide chain release factor [Irpex rosettiformis]